MCLSGCFHGGVLKGHFVKSSEDGFSVEPGMRRAVVYVCQGERQKEKIGDRKYREEMRSV